MRIAGTTFELSERDGGPCDARRAFEVIDSATSDDSRPAHPLRATLWLDETGAVILVTHVPAYLIDSPALAHSIRCADIMIQAPVHLVVRAGVKRGDRLNVLLRSD